MATASYYEAIGLLAICDAIESVEGVPLSTYQSSETPKPQLPASLRSTEKLNGTKDHVKRVIGSRYSAPYPYPPPAPPGFTDNTGLVQHPYLSHPLSGQPVPPTGLGPQAPPAYGYQPNQQPYPTVYPSPGHGFQAGYGGGSPFPAPGTPGTPARLALPSSTTPLIGGQVSGHAHNVATASPNTTSIPRPETSTPSSNASTPARSDSFSSDANAIYRSEDCPICGRNFKGPKASTHKQQHIRRLHPEDYTPKRGGKKRILLDGGSSVGGIGDRLQFSSLAQAASNPY
jgi:hypothetical protein